MKNINTIISKQTTRLTSKIVLLISIVPFFVISIYTRPAVDDYSYSIMTHETFVKDGFNVVSLIKAAIKENEYFFNNWNGDYISPFFASLQPGIYDERLYFVGVVSLLIITFFCFYYFIKTLDETFFNNKEDSLYISMILFVFFLQNTPDITQAIYWLMGAWDYTAYLLILLINMCMIMKYYSNENNRLVYVGISALASFVLPGGNVIYAFINILIVIFIFISFYVRKKDCKILMVSLILCIIGFIIMLLAPGSISRQNAYVQSGILQTIISSAFKVYELVALNWFNIKYISFTILIILIYYKKLNNITSKIHYNPIFLFMATFIIIAAIMCMPYYVMGSFGKGRIENVAWNMFVILTSFDLCYLFCWLKQQKILFFNTTKNIFYYLLEIVCVVLICFTYTNGNIIMHELIDGTAKNYAKECDKRYEINKVSKDEVVFFDKLPSSILNVGDLSTDINFWYNENWYEYYGKKVAIKR